MSETGNQTAKPETRKIGILSMGITLIAAGAVLLCVQLGWFDLARYQWLLPAYLIVLGAETLITRLLLNKSDPRLQLTPSVGSVAITLCILLFIRIWVLVSSTGIHTRFCW